MADKLTLQITDALSKAASEAAGLPLYCGKSEPGLFPTSATGKLAAQKCLAGELVHRLENAATSKPGRELYALTERGWTFLLSQLNPRQVLEDFVRVLEARRGEVGELLELARRMAESLQGLQEAVARILPSVIQTRLPQPHFLSRTTNRASEEAPSDSFSRVMPARVRPMDEHSIASDPQPTAVKHTHDRSVLAEAILTRLKQWIGAAGEDCPLPDLFGMLAHLSPRPTIGEFHDCLRWLNDEGDIYLHPWTGPLYALPEPALALLAGHNVAYYASIR